MLSLATTSAEPSYSCKDGEHCPKSMKDILIDSAIFGGICAAAVMTEHVPSVDDMYLVAKTFIFAFVTQLGYFRGIKRNQ